MHNQPSVAKSLVQGALESLQLYLDLKPDVLVLVARRGYCFYRAALKNKDIRVHAGTKVVTQRAIEIDREWLRGSTVLVLDDAFRTGRSVDAIRRSLKDLDYTAGALSVHADYESRKDDNLAYSATLSGNDFRRFARDLTLYIASSGIPYFVDFAFSSPIYLNPWEDIESYLPSGWTWHDVSSIHGKHSDVRALSGRLTHSARSAALNQISQSIFEPTESVRLRAWVRPQGESGRELIFMPKVILKPLRREEMLQFQALTLSSLDGHFEDASSPSLYRWVHRCISAAMIPRVGRTVSETDWLKLDAEEFAFHCPANSFGRQLMKLVSDFNASNASVILRGVSSATDSDKPATAVSSSDSSSSASIYLVSEMSRLERQEVDPESRGFRSAEIVKAVGLDDHLSLELSIDRLNDHGAVVPISVERDDGFVERWYRAGENNAVVYSTDVVLDLLRGDESLLPFMDLVGVSDSTSFPAREDPQSSLGVEYVGGSKRAVSLVGKLASQRGGFIGVREVAVAVRSVANGSNSEQDVELLKDAEESYRWLADELSGWASMDDDQLMRRIRLVAKQVSAWAAEALCAAAAEVSTELRVLLLSPGYSDETAQSSALLAEMAET